MVSLNPFKKPWEKEACIFDLQEYGLGGGKGWSSTHEAPEVHSKAELQEYFVPGRHYRLLARSLEDGKLKGTVWKHYEPKPGGGVTEKKPKKEKTKEAKEPDEVFEQYAEKVVKTLEPLGKITQAINDLRTSLFGEPPAPVVVQSADGGIPPPDFEGKLPVWVHPYVIRTAGEEVSRVLNQLFDRMGLVGIGPDAGKEEEEEEIVLPAPSEFLPKAEEEAIEEGDIGPPEGLEEAVEAPVIEEAEFPSMVETETAEGEEAIVPPTDEIPRVDVIVEEKVEEPVLEKACLRCGEVKPLLGNGICEACAPIVEEAKTTPKKPQRRGMEAKKDE